MKGANNLKNPEIPKSVQNLLKSKAYQDAIETQRKIFGTHGVALSPGIANQISQLSALTQNVYIPSSTELAVIKDYDKIIDLHRDFDIYNDSLTRALSKNYFNTYFTDSNYLATINSLNQISNMFKDVYIPDFKLHGITKDIIDLDKHITTLMETPVVSIELFDNFVDVASSSIDYIEDNLEELSEYLNDEVSESDFFQKYYQVKLELDSIKDTLNETKLEDSFTSVIEDDSKQYIYSIMSKLKDLTSNETVITVWKFIEAVSVFITIFSYLADFFDN